MTAHFQPPTKPSARSLFGEYVKPAHKAVSRMAGYSLCQCDEAAAQEFALVMRARLSEAECAFMAYSGLLSLDERARRIVKDLTA
ncbi:MAG: hypothetical protein AAGJ74_11690 [Pseudomonadota bacterium]